MTLQVQNGGRQKDIIVKKDQLQPTKTQIVIKLVDDNNKVSSTETFTCVDTNVNYLNQTGKNGTWKHITGGVQNIICRTKQEFEKWITSFERLAGKGDRIIDKNDQKRYDAMSLEQESEDSVRIGDFEISDFGL